MKANYAKKGILAAFVFMVFLAALLFFIIQKSMFT
jgi:hypothetical protein